MAFPSSVPSYPAIATGASLPAATVQSFQDEITAMVSAFVNGYARASAFNNTTQSLTDATATALTFNSEDFDVGGLHSTSSNTSRMTIPASMGGVYLLIGGTGFAPNATGFRQLDLKKNGTTILASTTVPSNTAGSPTGIFHLSFVAVLAAADYIELFATQNSGGPLNVGSATRNLASFLQVIRLW